MLHRNRLSELARKFSDESDQYVTLSQFTEYVEDNANGTIISRPRAAYLLREAGFKVLYHYSYKYAPEVMYCRTR
jgi:hypothetical protein